MNFRLTALLFSILTLISCSRLEDEQVVEVNEPMTALKKWGAMLGVASDYGPELLDSAGSMLQFVERKLEPSAELATAYRDLGWRYCDLKTFGPAMLNFHRSLEIAKKAKSDLDLVEAYLAIGWLFHRFNDYEKAKENYNQALPYTSKLKNSDLPYRVYHELAKVEIYAGKLEIALMYAQRGLQLPLTYSDNNYRIQLQNDIGIIYKRQKNYEASLQAFRDALSMAGNNFEKVGYVYGNIGDIFTLLGQTDSAIVYLTKDYGFSTNVGDAPSASSAALSLARLYLELNDRNQADKYLALSDSLYERDPERHVLPENAELRLQIINEMGNQAQQIEALQRYVRVMKRWMEIEKEENYKQLAAISVMHETSLELNKLEMEEDATRYQLYIAMSTGIGFFVFLIMLIFIYSNRNRLLKQQDRIRELNLLAKDNELQLLQRDKILQEKELELQSQITTAHQRQLEDSKKAHQQAVMAKEYRIEVKNKLIKTLTDALNPLDQFPSEVKTKLETTLKNINRLEETTLAGSPSQDDSAKDFIPTLQRDFPDLTQEELKLCTYIRLNMSSKEIARIKMITIPGVNKSRNRLRKKLGLGPEEDLHNFLLRY
jgi:tetratricopeptide (TPR) repeat protein